MSTITVSGRLTRDPELRYTPSGKAVLNLSIAENHSRRTETGEWVQTGTTFYNVTRWGGQNSSAEVEAIAQGLHKGDLALIIGKLRTREYERDGETRRGVELIADEVAASFRGQTVTVSRNQVMDGADAHSPADAPTT